MLYQLSYLATRKRSHRSYRFCGSQGKRAYFQSPRFLIRINSSASVVVNPRALA